MHFFPQQAKDLILTSATPMNTLPARVARKQHASVNSNEMKNTIIDQRVIVTVQIRDLEMKSEIKDHPSITTKPH